MENSPYALPKARHFLEVVVSDALDPNQCLALLRVWEPKADLDAALREGARLRLFNVTLSKACRAGRWMGDLPV